jgi:hypothetical protein
MLNNHEQRFKQLASALHADEVHDAAVIRRDVVVGETHRVAAQLTGKTLAVAILGAIPAWDESYVAIVRQLHYAEDVIIGLYNFDEMLCFLQEVKAFIEREALESN